MSSAASTTDAIWIVTEEIPDTSKNDDTSTPVASRGSDDVGGVLGGTETTEEIVVYKKEGEVVITRRKVKVSKLKEQMRDFLQAMREMLDEAETETPNSKMQLDEVELSVEINAEGQISLLGIGGGKAGGKGAMTFKFKRQ
ncbi:MAG: hypothetical protein AAFW70_19800 [Cyanobacteria bacterium J06635_10]